MTVAGNLMFLLLVSDRLELTEDQIEGREYRQYGCDGTPGINRCSPGPQKCE